MNQTLHRPFASVLIANRGEIAVRIVREAKAIGLRAIAVFSDADKGALWVEEAAAAVHIGASPARESYLNVDRILTAAKQTNAEAIHPGYGFLSENPDFAEAVIDAGLVWIGPSPSAIRAMADKGNAKEIARKADVPVIPGYDGEDQTDTRLLAEAKKIGWPVLIKAALGGGGRGQRRVTQESDFADALASAKREALSAFASDRIILEKALDNVRHVEVQVFGDAHGNIIQLGERDCSIQRRNQKIIEEAPAPGVSKDLRTRLGDAASRLAHAVNYTNAGTVEFLLDRDGKFYFLEMNTRIQVEHPVTEMATGLNLVQWQLTVARGEQLPLKQSQVNFTGYAIEGRLCAEDPGDAFRPQQGLARLHRGLRGVRMDAISEGPPFTVAGDYDSLVAKVIANGSSREEARVRLREALNHITLLGIRSNKNLLIDILGDEAFVDARFDIAWLARRTQFVDDNLDGVSARVAALCLARGQNAHWRSTGVARSFVRLRERGKEKTFVIENGGIDGMRLAAPPADDGDVVDGFIFPGFVDGARKGDAEVLVDGRHVHVQLDGRDAFFEDVTYAPAEPKGASGANIIRAPMAGRIVKVAAESGAKVAKNQILVVLEAMKMEHELRAAADGVVQSISVKPGDQVAIRQTLVTLSPST